MTLSAVRSNISKFLRDALVQRFELGSGTILTSLRKDGVGVLPAALTPLFSLCALVLAGYGCVLAFGWDLNFDGTDCAWNRAVVRIGLESLQIDCAVPLLPDTALWDRRLEWTNSTALTLFALAVPLYTFQALRPRTYVWFLSSVAFVGLVIWLVSKKPEGLEIGTEYSAQLWGTTFVLCAVVPLLAPTLAATRRNFLISFGYFKVVTASLVAIAYAAVLYSTAAQTLHKWIFDSLEGSRSVELSLAKTDLVALSRVQDGCSASLPESFWEGAVFEGLRLPQVEDPTISIALKEMWLDKSRTAVGNRLAFQQCVANQTKDRVTEDPPACKFVGIGTDAVVLGQLAKAYGGDAASDKKIPTSRVTRQTIPPVGLAEPEDETQCWKDTETKVPFAEYLPYVFPLAIYPVGAVHHTKDVSGHALFSHLATHSEKTETASASGTDADVLQTYQLGLRHAWKLVPTQLTEFSDIWASLSPAEPGHYWPVDLLTDGFNSDQVTVSDDGKETVTITAADGKDDIKQALDTRQAFYTALFESAYTTTLNSDGVKDAVKLRAFLIGPEQVIMLALTAFLILLIALRSVQRRCFWRVANSWLSDDPTAINRIFQVKPDDDDARFLIFNPKQRLQAVDLSIFKLAMIRNVLLQWKEAGGPEKELSSNTRDLLRNQIEEGLSRRMGPQKEQWKNSRWFISAGGKLLPAIGFIGTVRGIMDALGDADTIVRATTQTDQAAAVTEVAGILGISFTTTFVALLLSMIITVIDDYQTKEEREVLENLRTHILNTWREMILDPPKNTADAEVQRQKRWTALVNSACARLTQLQEFWTALVNGACARLKKLQKKCTDLVEKLRSWYCSRCQSTSADTSTGHTGTSGSDGRPQAPDDTESGASNKGELPK